MTYSTTGDLAFMGGTKFYPVVYAESSQWNTLINTHFILQKFYSGLFLYSFIRKYKIYMSFGSFWKSHSIRDPYWLKELHALVPERHVYVLLIFSQIPTLNPKKAHVMSFRAKNKMDLL